MSAEESAVRIPEKLLQRITVPPTRLKALGISKEAWAQTFRIVRERPQECAFRTLTRAQLVIGVLLLCFVGAFIIWSPTLSLTVINSFLMTFYITIVVYKLYLIHLSLGEARELSFTPEDLNSLQDEDLPPYTILVPLYREKESLERLIAAISRLDYPREKLQVLLLLEESDTDTVEAVKALRLPHFISPIITPECPPKTKPKACNLGLAHATGEILVIYDAEDRPEPDQLKKAVLGFRRSPPEVICLQARLNFYNKRQNLLTRLFTLEYSMWFDLFLPGMGDIRSPIPLGGTSNHFRIDKLRQLMGWDPFNVTEDCDLGIRLAGKGYETRMLDSTTWEEACGHPGFWIRQRSRWIKGYIQTYLVALRRPGAITRKLGFGRALGFHLMIGGTPLCLLINPIYWALTLLWFTLRWEGVTAYFPFPVILWALVCLFAGNFVFIYATLLAAYRRKYFDIVKYGLLVPFYWMLMSIGAWKGCLQLITRPNYWEKTRHGLDIEAGYQEDHETGETAAS